MLALVAYLTKKKLKWDAKNLAAINCPEAENILAVHTPLALLIVRVGF